MTDTYVHAFAGAIQSIPSPIADNLVAMDAYGNLIDSGVAATTSSTSNDNLHVPTTEAMQTAISAAVTRGTTFQGSWDASSDTYPTLDQFGAPIEMGDYWRITVEGILGGQTVFPGDEILALINVPGQTAGNWSSSIGAGVRSFNARVGVVLPLTGDYAVAQVTGAAPLASPALTGNPTSPTQSPGDDSTHIATTAYVDTGLALKADITYVDAGLTLKSDITYVDAGLALKAPLASPALTGVPTTPTASPGTSTTQIASTAFTAAGLALKSDITYVDAGLALKANIASPALTGAPTAPTASLGTNTTQIATTTFVSAAAAAGVTSFNSRTGAVMPTTADYTVAQVTGAAPLASPALTGSPTAPTQLQGDSSTHIATTAYVDTGLALKAPLASPALTGTPTAPTQTQGDNSTNLATTAYVDTGLAPKAVTTTVNAALALKAPLASPALTGTPTAPTATPGDNSTLIATTAFVDNAVASSGVTSFNTRTGAVVPAGGDYTYSQVTGAAPLASPALTGSPTAPTKTQGDNSTNLSTTAYVDTGLALKAPLASPALTGTPTAPTQTAGDNSTHIATTAYADTALALKAPLASPALTGNPTAPTQSPGDNSTHLATTAYVDTGLALKAPLASPALTGIPTAPTASPGTSTTQLATTAFVAASAGVTSFNTRTGAVVPAGGDYTYSQVTGAAPLASPALTGSPTAPTKTQGDNSTNLATTAYVDTGLALKAPLASPTLTGVPAAPTASPGTNTTQLATTAFVAASAAAGVTSFNTRVGAVVPASADYAVGQVTGAAPLASPALTGSPTAPTQSAGDNSTHIATTAYVDTGLALKSNIASPSFTGVPAAPTATAGTNTTQLATTAFVETAVANTTNALSLVQTTLTSTVNSVASNTVSVSPGAQSITGSVTFTNLSEIILLCAPLQNAIGTYFLQLRNLSAVVGATPPAELNLGFVVSGNTSASVGQASTASIEFFMVNDSEGLINTSNISNYLLFRGFYSNQATPYFAVGMSMPNSLIYGGVSLSMTVWQYGASYLNDNSTLSALITGDVSNLVNTYPVDNIFNMNTSYVPVTTYTPQGYIYICSSVGGANTLNLYSIAPTTGLLTNIGSATVTGPNYAASTKLRNYLYVTSGTSTPLISMFSINLNTGLLTALSPATVTPGNTPQGIIVEPTDRFVYCCNSGANTISQYSITKATGELVALGTPTIASGTGPNNMACHPSGRFLYVTNKTANTVSQYSIDKSSGQLTSITTAIASGSGPLNIVIHPSGLFAYVSNGGTTTISQYSINQSTGALSALSPATFTTNTAPQGLSISQNGKYLYICNNTTGNVEQATISIGLGTLGTPTTTATLATAGQCVIDFSGTYFYANNRGGDVIAQYIITQSTGALVPLSTATIACSGAGLGMVSI